MWYNVAALFELDENLQNDFLIFEAPPNVSHTRHALAEDQYAPGFLKLPLSMTSVCVCTSVVCVHV